MITDEQRRIVNLFLNNLTETDAEAFILWLKRIEELRQAGKEIQEQKQLIDDNQKLIDELEGSMKKMENDQRKTNVIPFARK